MAKRRMTGRPTPAGYLNDGSGVAISLPTPQGEFFLEVPFDQMQALGHLMAQGLDVSVELDGLVRQPSPLPAIKWEAGANREFVVLRLTVDGGGAYAFYLERDFAAKLRDGITEALEMPPQDDPALN